MRIVIDMQGAQTESRFRGIGRYTLSFSQAVVRNRGEHEIILALSGLFPDTIEPIRAAFDGLLPQENIRVWHAPGPVADKQPGNDARREIAELTREAFLASLQPDVIHICSLFDGYVDDAVASIGRFDQNTPVSVALYDLIPLLNPDQYLRPNPSFELYYRRKIDDLKKASRFLAISEFSRNEGIDNLQLDKPQVVNVGTAVEPQFQQSRILKEVSQPLFKKCGIARPYVLYTGGADERKNLPRLIQGYAALPRELRQKYQLLFAGKMPEGNIADFKRKAIQAGLECHELCFSGYVSDEELVQLYNLCELYVFPSWHEGFGLPALEAMASGAPVIGANSSSLPEVIGLDDALFDPMDVESIRNKMHQALTDSSFRKRLCEHGLRRAKSFTWDKTAKRAIAAWETLPSPDQARYLETSLNEERFFSLLGLRLRGQNDATISNLSACIAINQQAGIQRQLLVDVSELCQHDAATGVQRVVRSYLKGLLHSPPAGFRVEPVYATRDHGYRYARRFTLDFLGQYAAQASDRPIRWQRGDIFFALDMQHHVQLAHKDFYQRLRQAGVTVKFLVYDLLPIQLADYFRNSNAKELHEQLLAMIVTTDGAVCISKATADALIEWTEGSNRQSSPNFKSAWVHIGADIEGSAPSKGLPPDADNVFATLAVRHSFLCVATLEPRKGQQQILEAVEQLWAQKGDVNLVLVGQQGWKTEELAERIRTHPELGRRLFWLQGISDEYLEKIYSACSCLIAASLNEGFGLPLIEAARHGLPIVARDIAVFREVAAENAYYFTGETPPDLASALQKWLALFTLEKHPKSHALHWSTWQQSTERLKAALIEQNYPRRQLLVDISELVQRDAKTGIQRVVRNVLSEWLKYPPVGYRVEPVYATVDQPYRYARQFTSHFLGAAEPTGTDEPIDFTSGDIFFVLDLQPQVQVAQSMFLQNLRRGGVTLKFMVYDLLAVQHSDHFVEGASEGFTNWLHVVGESDGAVCISRSVAEELERWMVAQTWQRQSEFKIEWNHLGADIEPTRTHHGRQGSPDTVISQLQDGETFLMVGTLEPRKGHAQVLDAFEQLWREKHEMNLVLVGKQGWLVESLTERLRNHPEMNNRLFWLEGISDEYLEAVYADSTCLIAASYGEGFGLPLIEAAQHKLPIIARDIPVFREVAGEYAHYFSAETSDELAQTIIDWLLLYRAEGHLRPDKMRWLTWKESAYQLSDILTGQHQ